MQSPGRCRRDSRRERLGGAQESDFQPEDPVVSEAVLPPRVASLGPVRALGHEGPHTRSHRPGTGLHRWGSWSQSAVESVAPGTSRPAGLLLTARLPARPQETAGSEATGAASPSRREPVWYPHSSSGIAAPPPPGSPRARSTGVPLHGGDLDSKRSPRHRDGQEPPVYWGASRGLRGRHGASWGLHGVARSPGPAPGAECPRLPFWRGAGGMCQAVPCPHTDAAARGRPTRGEWRTT